MKLPDFLQDEAFNRLRQHMGATELGQFELFDPSRQLTWSEREALAGPGLNVAGNDLRVLKDKTLAYKNSRVWVEQEGVYHLAYCQPMQSLRHHGPQLHTGTSEWPASKEGGVCLECLALLQYQGIDARRLRRTEFVEQMREHFSLEEFCREYPFYPIV